MFLITLTALLILGSHAASIFENRVERGDSYIDKLLKDMIDENGHEYDPYRLEDSKVGFNKRIAFVNISGEAKLHNGYITGLKSLHRSDHCTVKEVKNGRLLVTAVLGAGVLNYHYDGTVTFMNFGPTISVHGILHYLETYMEFTVDSDTGKNGKLTKFKIDDMRGLSITITGLGPMNWALNSLISAIQYAFNGYMKRLMENKIRDHIAERLPNYPFPVEDGTEIVPPEITTETETHEETEHVNAMLKNAKH